ncbi:IS66 family element, transposase domain protein [Leptospira alexanderi serovar Manhao 3 str. L 60]|uniref:IS66 family element, transposase domain protein n=1 Tax=Leptospira alexanderi serovar Manhao 3 str. L 60 TaxID=1049759 RepID=V6I7X9_9LEPT|nr:IS66 family element, transposase domain protein [Leptospira alexanderi serovar Manhao 3 str. L 60]
MDRKENTNLVENDIRPFVVGRKNWLFSSCPQGATASAEFYSLERVPKPISETS